MTTQLIKHRSRKVRQLETNVLTTEPHRQPSTITSPTWY